MERRRESKETNRSEKDHRRSHCTKHFKLTISRRFPVRLWYHANRNHGFSKALRRQVLSAVFDIKKIKLPYICAINAKVFNRDVENKTVCSEFYDFI